MEKYKDIKEREIKGCISSIKTEKKEEIIDVNLSIKEALERKMYEYNNKNVGIKYEEKQKGVFINGDTIDFERVMSNIINNGIEAVEGKKVEIAVSCEVKGKQIEIRIKDNGKGMPKEMVDKIMKGEEIGTTKKERHGIGTQQIMSTVKAMEGRVEIKAEDNVGTEVILTFPSKS